ncbi:hypothetical protein RCL1_000347 [Eukaryota sp. TZLM3-RCL]
MYKTDVRVPLITPREKDGIRPFVQILNAIIVFCSLAVTLIVLVQNSIYYQSFKAVTTTFIVMIAFIRSTSSKITSKWYQNSIIVGLLFGLIGDIFLVHNLPIFFIMGMFAFLVGHLFFATAFMEFKFSVSWSFVTVMAVLDFIYLVTVVRHAPLPLRIGASCYTVVISIMVITSFQRFLLLKGSEMKKTLHIYYGFIGTVFFMFSDLMLGSYVFHPSLAEYKLVLQVIALIFYWIGQFLIACSL